MNLDKGPGSVSSLVFYDFGVLETSFGVNSSQIAIYFFRFEEGCYNAALRFTFSHWLRIHEVLYNFHRMVKVWLAGTECTQFGHRNFSEIVLRGDRFCETEIWVIEMVNLTLNILGTTNYAFGETYFRIYCSVHRLMSMQCFYRLHALCCGISEYLDEATLIPKNTSVMIRRIPGRPRMPIVTDSEYYLRSF